MATKIPYVDEVWNPVVGCTKCSPGCKNCYAERMAIRLNGMAAARGDDDTWCKMTNILKWDRTQPDKYEFGRATGWNGQVELFVNRLDKPLHWKKPRRILTCSMSDLFHEAVPFEFIRQVYSIAASCSQHTFLFLTKRVDRMLDFSRAMGPGSYHSAPPVKWPRNMFPGVSICTQAEADEKISILLQIPAAYRWVSLEPLLWCMDLTRIGGDQFGWGRIDALSGLRYIRANALEEGSEWETEPCEKLNQVVIGCESLPGKAGRFQEGYENAARSLIQQCTAAGVPTFHKQMPINGKVVHDPSKFPEDMRQQEIVDGT